MRRARLFRALTTCVLLPVVAVACGDDDEERNTGECRIASDNDDCAAGLVCQQLVGGGQGEGTCVCSEANQSGCDDGEACEAVVNGNSQCFPRITVTGQVIDLATGEPIEGARVVAQDANGAAASGIAVTDAMGNYELTVPTRRNADGTPASDQQVTLRADASGYLTYPLAPRVAIPIETSTGTSDAPIETPATTIALIGLEDAGGRGTITGTVVDTDSPWGTLVVAGGAVNTGGGVTGIADRDGSYTVFNVPAGTQDVSGYKTGLQIEPTTAMVTAGETTEGVDLHATGEATTVVSGKIEIVNPGMGSNTSVILVVDETFIPNAARGEAPPGLRVGNISGDFRFEGVPNGNYVVLAAFENDFLVRDPDTAIGGTQIVHITVPGAVDPIQESFKVTGSLDDPSPDGEEVVSGTPVFTWTDDSGEDHYEIRVYDAFGTLIWEDLNVPGASGGDPSVTYAGPPLEPGNLYQFRATAIKQGGTPISITEDLKGVFVYQ